MNRAFSAHKIINDVYPGLRPGLVGATPLAWKEVPSTLQTNMAGGEGGNELGKQTKCLPWANFAIVFFEQEGTSR